MKNTKQPGVGPVVSAAHLARGAMPALSEVEYALIVAGNAFERWMVRCATAAGLPALAAIDILVLHSVHHREREKSLADLCLVLNVEDTHLVNYAIKKLSGLGLIGTKRRGKEKVVVITAAGTAACERYHKTREALLVQTIQSLGLDPQEISKAAMLIRALSGQYDQAARSAASL